MGKHKRHREQPRHKDHPDIGPPQHHQERKEQEPDQWDREAQGCVVRGPENEVARTGEDEGRKEPDPRPEERPPDQEGDQDGSRHDQGPQAVVRPRRVRGGQDRGHGDEDVMRRERPIHEAARVRQRQEPGLYNRVDEKLEVRARIRAADPQWEDELIGSKKIQGDQRNHREGRGHLFCRLKERDAEGNHPRAGGHENEVRGRFAVLVGPEREQAAGGEQEEEDHRDSKNSLPRRVRQGSGIRFRFGCLPAPRRDQIESGTRRDRRGKKNR